MLVRGWAIILWQFLCRWSVFRSTRPERYRPELGCGFTRVLLACCRFITVGLDGLVAEAEDPIRLLMES